MFVDRAISDAMFIETEPDQERRFNTGRIIPEKVKRGDSISE